MPRPPKYPEELIQRGVRLALESGRPIAHVAKDLGLPSETLRKRVRQAEADQRRSSKFSRFKRLISSRSSLVGRSGRAPD